MGPSWPIRRKASWAKRCVSVNFPSSFGRGVPDQGPLTVEQSHAARPLPRDQHLAAGGEQRPEQASPSHHEVCAHHGDSIYRNPQTQQQQGFLPIPRMSVPLCSPLKARQKENLRFSVPSRRQEVSRLPISPILSMSSCAGKCKSVKTPSESTETFSYDTPIDHRMS